MEVLVLLRSQFSLITTDILTSRDQKDNVAKNSPCIARMLTPARSCLGQWTFQVRFTPVNNKSNTEVR